MKIIIPARGGSKRIANKNIIDLNGAPLISYVINTSLKITSDVYVSTDCVKIEEVARKFGAKIIRRPANLATDTSTTNSVVEHFLNEIVDINYFACVQPTSPLITAAYLKRGFNKIQKNEYNSVISVFENVNFFWTAEGTPINFKKNAKPRTQDMQRWYSENGAFYITSKKSFLKTKNIINGKVGFIVMPKAISFEIDTHEDLDTIKKLIR